MASERFCKLWLHQETRTKNTKTSPAAVSRGQPSREDLHGVPDPPPRLEPRLVSVGGFWVRAGLQGCAGLPQEAADSTAPRCRRREV